MLVLLVPPEYNASDAHVRVIRLNLLKLSQHYNITVVCDDKSSTLHFPMKCFKLLLILPLIERGDLVAI